MNFDRQIDINLIDSLRLIRSDNVGSRLFIELVKLCGSPSEAIKQAPELAKRGGRLKSLKICTTDQASRELEQVKRYGGEILSYDHPDYPQILLQIYDFPPIITIMGCKALLNQTIIAIVGARNASANGCRFAYKLAEDLGRAGLVIASGLARGIDTAAHKGSICTGAIAVIAGGINNIYPPENKDLYHQIASNGVVIAELPFDANPKAQHFPQRNRIISGISKSVAVVEASFGSGSLITAKCALNQDRELFAVPGFPLDPRCQGTNNLIKDGSKLLTSAQDIIDELNNINNISQMCERQNNYQIMPQAPGVNEDDLRLARPVIKNLLGASPITIDELVKICDYGTSVVLVALLELELAEKIERYPGNKVALTYCND